MKTSGAPGGVIGAWASAAPVIASEAVKVSALADTGTHLLPSVYLHVGTGGPRHTHQCRSIVAPQDTAVQASANPEFRPRIIIP